MVVKKFCVPTRLSTFQQIGYAIVCVFLLELSVHFVFTHRNLVPSQVSKLLGCYMVKPHGQLV
ncbi:hypothetical protein, partial [Pseudomonas koreensis]|uniref:hypothetical protein n=1 Tax=Pseudomonas koreensis TaxID=198620 RepID=UPI001C2C8BF4